MSTKARFRAQVLLAAAALAVFALGSAAWLGVSRAPGAPVSTADTTHVSAPAEGARLSLANGRLHLPPEEEIERLLRVDGTLAPDATPAETAATVRRWVTERSAGHEASAAWEAHERSALAGNSAVAQPITAEVLAIPVEFGASESLTFLRQDAGRQCVTVTERFTGPLHGAIPYPGGSPSTTLDNQTTYYPSTEPADYEQLIFGREGYTKPLRAGDPNVNGGAGVDIGGLTVQTYYEAQSDHTVTITGTVAPWVAMPHSEAFYGLDVCLPNMSAVAIPDEQLASLADLTVSSVEAVKALGGRYATYAFWKRFDRDEDGFVDALWILHAGRGQEYGGGSEGAASLWSRAGSVQAYAGYEAGYVIHDNDTVDPADDVKIADFTMLPEDSDIGVMVEEFGHSFFDVPDLYSSRSSNSVGWWAPMSAGIWGGELAGTRPVNMPLFHRMVADCGGRSCGWADPVKTVTYTTSGETVVLGQAGTPAGGTVAEGPLAGQTIHEGLRIQLPPQVEVQGNPAGQGGGAYSTADTSADMILVRAVDLTSASAPIALTMDAYWQIPRIFGYAYVEVAVGTMPYVTLPDLDGRFTDENPFGNNDGFGLTGTGSGQLRFDLSAFSGQRISLRLRYSTYQGGPGTGWWIDNLAVGEALRDDFEAGLTGWTASGWVSVPRTLRHDQYYLVEWRNANGFDASLLGAYSTSVQRDDEWRVDRVPANVPGAVVMLRNLRYPLDGTFTAHLAKPPSYGSKYGLLVVDPNFWPTLRPSGQPFAGRLESLDATLALGNQADYVLEVRDPATGELQNTEAMTGVSGARAIDDAFGTYPGFYTDAEGKALEWDQDASAVLPSRDDKMYSTRITRPDRSRPHPLDGEAFMGVHVYGSGDPGDNNAALGVKLEVVDQAPDGSWGAVRVVNKAVDYLLSVTPSVALPGGTVTYTIGVDNVGSVLATVRFTFTLPAGFEHLGAISDDGTVLPPGSALTGSGAYSPGTGMTLRHVARVPPGGVPESALEPALAAFDDGEHTWERRVALTLPVRVYLPDARGR